MIKRYIHNIPGMLITAVLLIHSIVITILLAQTNMVPSKYILLLCAAMLVWMAAVCALTWTIRRRKCFVIGSLLAVLALVGFIMGFVSIHRVTDTLKDITDNETEVAQVSVYVNADDQAQSLQDAADYTFGILKHIDRENTDLTLETLRDELGKSVTVVEYATLPELIDALLNGDIGAILLNAAFIDVLEDLDGYTYAASLLREIKVTHVEIPLSPSPDVDKDGIFTVFISGIDTNGSLRARGRSDVNIIATINTHTHEVLLLTTPRDCFVELPISKGQKDKLTHAGIYGIDVSTDTIETLYDIDIDYYFRLNFSGFCQIIDAIGGVDVYSEYTFSLKFHDYVKGYNHMDGKSALAFARERYSFANGDIQRGKNQMAVIKAVITKLTTSTALLKNFSSLMDSLKDCFETNIPYDQVAILVRDQLDTMPSWTVHTYNVTGKGAYQTLYSSSSNAYVMIPDDESIATAKEKIQAVIDGKKP